MVDVKSIVKPFGIQPRNVVHSPAEQRLCYAGYYNRLRFYIRTRHEWVRTKSVYTCDLTDNVDDNDVFRKRLDAHDDDML